MKTGDKVWIGCEDRFVEGEILLASPNAKSLMLGFEAILCGHVGRMPVIQDPSGGYRSLVGNHAVSVAPRP